MFEKKENGVVAGERLVERLFETMRSLLSLFGEVRESL
jgi:nicotinate-nucleotide pyrophosphorylase